MTSKKVRAHRALLSLLALAAACDGGAPRLEGDGGLARSEDASSSTREDTGPILDAADDTTDARSSDGSTSPGNPLLFGVMVHLEGRRFATAMDLTRFMEQLDAYATLFEAHGARLTLESKETTDASASFGDTTLARLDARGHHVAIHADVGGLPDPAYSTERMRMDLLARRARLDTLGITYRHVSGVCSDVDWLSAVEAAGFSFVTGGVAYCLMSLPVSARPAEYRDCASAAACHDVWPSALAERLHPWRMRAGTDWTRDDPDGEVVFLPSGGSLTCAADEAAGRPCAGMLEAEDIDENRALLDDALAALDPSRVNALYISWSIGPLQDEGLLEAFLAMLDPYVAEGRVVWATMPEMFDAYVAWERSGGRER